MDNAAKNKATVRCAWRYNAAPPPSFCWLSWRSHISRWRAYQRGATSASAIASAPASSEKKATSDGDNKHDIAPPRQGRWWQRISAVWRGRCSLTSLTHINTAPWPRLFYAHYGVAGLRLART